MRLNRPRMLELPIIIRVFARIFVDGSHPKLSLNNPSNNPSTCLPASDILARREPPGPSKIPEAGQTLLSTGPVGL